MNELCLMRMCLTDERRLGMDEKPLLVQLNWHMDDREGRFLLRRIDDKTNVSRNLGSVLSTKYLRKCVSDFGYRFEQQNLAVSIKSYSLLWVSWFCSSVVVGEQHFLARCSCFVTDVLYHVVKCYRCETCHKSRQVLTCENDS